MVSDNALDAVSTYDNACIDRLAIGEVQSSLVVVLLDLRQSLAEVDVLNRDETGQDIKQLFAMCLLIPRKLALTCMALYGLSSRTDLRV